MNSFSRFVGHPLQDPTLLRQILSNFPRNEVEVWQQRLAENQRGDFSVAMRLERPPTDDALDDASDDASYDAGVVVQDLGGRASLIWPPFGEAGDETWRQMATWLDEELRRRDTIYVQSLLPPENEWGIQRVQQLGLRRITTIDYMISSPDEREPVRSRFPFALVDDSPRIAALIAQTYTDTLDCPELDGIRDVADVLAGYRAAAPIETWVLNSDTGEDAGVLILSDHAAFAQTELTYMGLVPSFRGRGLGSSLVEFAIERAQQKNRDKVVLAVDRRNAPAIRQYQQFGFRSWISRVCLMRELA